MTREEMLLNGIVNGQTGECVQPITRTEYYLYCLLNGKGSIPNLPEPITRSDYLLYELAQRGIGSGGTGSTLVIDIVEVTPIKNAILP